MSIIVFSRLSLDRGFCADYNVHVSISDYLANR